MKILYNNQQFLVPDDFQFPKRIQLELAIASPESPGWIPVLGQVDTGNEYPMAISKNILAKHGIKFTVIGKAKVAFADGQPRDAEMVALNLLVRGVNSEAATILGVPALLLDDEDQIILGSILYLFTTILKKGRIEFCGFDRKSIT